MFASPGYYTITHFFFHYINYYRSILCNSSIVHLIVNILVIVNRKIVNTWYYGNYYFILGRYISLF